MGGQDQAPDHEHCRRPSLLGQIGRHGVSLRSSPLRFNEGEQFIERRVWACVGVAVAIEAPIKGCQEPLFRRIREPASIPLQCRTRTLPVARDELCDQESLQRVERSGAKIQLCSQPADQPYKVDGNSLAKRPNDRSRNYRRALYQQGAFFGYFLGAIWHQGEAAQPPHQEPLTAGFHDCAGVQSLKRGERFPQLALAVVIRQSEFDLGRLRSISEAKS